MSRSVTHTEYPAGVLLIGAEIPVNADKPLYETPAVVGQRTMDGFTAVRCEENEAAAAGFVVGQAIYGEVPPTMTKIPIPEMKEAFQRAKQSMQAVDGPQPRLHLAHVWEY